ncbi:MAG: anti-sigma factor family protein [Candidatus Saccharicenans sp.]|uniref:anti-sigma factor family protein n=1 Tax=Candidatus Saccharicenans sp. TaxID=2819258 RepID=UPI0040493167
MGKCKFEDLIDGYLLNRLSKGDREAFEEHYFNCSSCFELLQERDVIIRTIKNNPALLEEKEEARSSALAGLRRELASFLTVRQLAFAGITALLVLVIIFTVIPRNQVPAPNFFLTDEETVRGSSITLISPVIDMNQIPSSFEWKKLGDNIEYQISISNGELLWKATTRENWITLPDEVKAKMVPGMKYSWQVKAFGPDGSLIAVSSRVQLKISAD